LIKVKQMSKTYAEQLVEATIKETVGSAKRDWGFFPIDVQAIIALLEAAEAELRIIRESCPEHCEVQGSVAGTVQSYIVELESALAKRGEAVYQHRVKLTPLWEDCDKATFDRIFSLSNYETRTLFSAPQVAPEWQPIESAPKDGTEIWAFDESEHQCLAYWMDYPKWSGWIFVDELLADIHPAGINPTHWMHKPAAPQPEARG